jgi:DNA-binding transcriptional MerR regulator
MDLKFVKPGYLTIREASRRVNVSTHTLRYWEKALEGIVTPSRTAGGQRRYSREDLRLLETVKQLKRQGLTLSSIREELSRDFDEKRRIADDRLLDLLVDHIAETVRSSIYRFFYTEKKD